MLTRSALAGAMLVAVAGGCSNVLIRYRPADERAPKRPEKSPEAVMLLRKLPARPYLEVGWIKAEQDDPNGDGEPVLLTEMRKRAAKAGCDALVFRKADRKTMEGQVWGGGGWGGAISIEETTRAGYFGRCLVFTGEAAEDVRRVTHLPEVNDE